MGVKLEAKEPHQAFSGGVGFSCAEGLGLVPPNSPHWDFPVDQRAYVDASLGKKSMLWEKLVNRG